MIFDGGYLRFTPEEATLMTEPIRVLTREEAAQRRFCVTELRNGIGWKYGAQWQLAMFSFDRVKHRVTVTINPDSELEETNTYHMSAYDTLFRCWNTIPTEEEMRNTPWEEP